MSLKNLILGFVFRAVLTLAALLYLLFVIKEPLKVEEEAKEGNKEENEKVGLIFMANELLLVLDTYFSIDILGRLGGETATRADTSVEKTWWANIKNRES